MKSAFLLLVFSAFLTCIAGTISAQSFLSHQIELKDTEPEKKPETKIPSPVQEESELKVKTEEEELSAPESARTLFPYDAETLSMVKKLIEDGEIQLAQEILNNLGFEKEEKADDIKDLQLDEVYQFFLVKTAYLQGELETVIELARGYLQHFAYEKNFPKTFYYFISSLAQLEKPLEMTALITEDFFQSISEEEGLRLRRILSEYALKNNQPIMAYTYLKLEDEDLSPEDAAYVMTIIETLDNLDDLNDLVDQVSQPLLKGELRLKRVQMFVKMQDFIAAEEEMNSLMEESDDFGDEFLSRFSTLYEFILQSKRVKPNRIGVILPFSSKRYGHLAASLLEGLELALQEFKDRETPIELVLRDSELSPSTVQKHVTELIEKQNVIAILGPLARKTSVVAGQTAAPYKVPVISFSLTENVGEELPFLFRYQRDEIQEARNMVDYAMDYLGAKRFVIFYDTSRSTYEKIQAFWERVHEKGGEVVGIERVAKNQLDFRQAFRRVTGTYRYLSDEEKEVFGDLLKDREDAEIDFDAMYIPLAPERVKMIVSFAKAYNAEKAWILGDHQLNNSRNLLLRSFWRLRFTDSYSIGASLTNLQRFFDQHWKLYNFRKSYKKPGAYTLYGFEALLILEKLLNDPLLHTREALRNALASLENFSVPSGNVNTSSSGELVKDIKILKLYRGQTAKVFR